MSEIAISEPLQTEVEVKDSFRTFVIEENVVPTKDIPHKVPRIDNAYGLSSMFNREQKLITLTIETGKHVQYLGDTVAMTFVMSNPAYSIVKNNYAFFKFDAIVLRFIMRSTPYHFGSVFIKRTPGDDGEASYAAGKYAALIDPDVELEIAPEQTAEVRIPWNFAFDRLPTNYNSTGLGIIQLEQHFRYITNVTFVSIMSALSPTVSTTIPLDVYMRIEGFEPSVPQFMLTPPEMIAAQSFMREHPAIIIPGLAAVAGVAKTANDYWKIGKEAVNTGREAASLFTGDSKEAKESVDSQDRSYDKQDGTVLDNVGSTLTMEATPYGSIVDFNSRQGYVNPERYGDTEIRHNFWNLVGKRQIEIFDMMTFIGQRYKLRVCPDARVTGSLADLGEYPAHSFGYMAYFSNIFMYWRGSIEYCVKIWAPFDTVAELMIIHAPLNVSSQDTTMLTSKCWSQTISIKGTTEVSFRVPFPREEEWVPIYEVDDRAAQTPCLLFQLTRFNTASSATVISMPIAVWSRPGPDFDFRCLAGPKLWKTEPEKIEAQSFSDICDLPGEFLPLQRQFTYVEEIMGRWQTTDLPIELEAKISAYHEPDFPESTLYDFVACLYQFVRGAVSVKVLLNTVQTNEFSRVTRSVVIPGTRFPTSPISSYFETGPEMVKQIKSSPVQQFDYERFGTCSVYFTNQLRVPWQADYWNDVIQFLDTPIEGLGSNEAILKRPAPNFQLILLMPLMKTAYWPSAQLNLLSRPRAKNTKARPSPLLATGAKKLGTTGKSKTSSISFGGQSTVYD